jgi:hypothetical protein
VARSRLARRLFVTRCRAVGFAHGFDPGSDAALLSAYIVLRPIIMQDHIIHKDNQLT